MAVIFENQSTCPLCGEVLNRQKAYTGFPPFVANRKDPLYIFNDAGVHVDCLHQHPLGELALQYREKHIQCDAKTLTCTIDGKVILPSQERIIFYLLISDEKEALSKFNFLIINKNNTCKWAQREEFVRTVKEFIKDGKWEGSKNYNHLDYLIQQVCSVA